MASAPRRGRPRVSPRIRYALAVALALPGTTVAAATLDQGFGYSTEPVPSEVFWRKDAVLALLREYAAAGQTHAYINESTDASYSRWVFGGDETPYAELRENVSLSPVDEPTREAMYLVAEGREAMTQRQLHDWKVRDLGYTKATAMREAPVPDDLRDGAWGVPHILKAGVDADIYKACMRGILDIGRPAMQANYAMALQVLRERLLDTPRDAWYERGLRSDVIGRFLDPARHGQPHRSDMHYLIQLLDGELSTWRATSATNRYGFPALPANLRLARIAAAYREGMPGGTDACLPNGRHDPAKAGMGGADPRPLCLADATDRAIHRWYGQAIIDEVLAVGDISGESLSTSLQNLASPLQSSSLGHLGIPLDGQLDRIVTLDMAEAKAANRLVSVGQMSMRQGDMVLRHVSMKQCGRTP
ncbi:hypothetical protein SAMN02800692_3142 [Luteibacter sp. UNC138MFCol5.1]|uniref:hypothetical protein n=1 Tax=Luteibacter sp. UNC138MFCol5.1 TaxID=1502774 RepID=UPI0008B78443|nr:hypothetical protein [Luteibacter sp. UNC138MFCol5.1]SEO99813.1 hypothetical protein SAMN02800692_3142 [Luteibacter sp. UNC138MFCol5.1]